MKRIDVIVPAYNEQDCLERFHAALVEVLDALPYEFRVIYVDDGSTDRTRDACRRLRARDPRVEFIGLSRNFGHQAALTAGIDWADADAVITMDADLQHPPSAVPDLIAAWEAGAEVVSAVRAEAEGLGTGKRLSAAVFYRVLNWMSEVPITPQAPDFRLLDARAVAAIRQVRERSRFLRGICSWVGFRQCTVTYCQAERAGGHSKYDVFRMARFGLSALLSFSRVPLRVSTWFGVLVSGLTFLYGVYAVAQSVVLHRAVPGWTSLAVLLSFLSGIQLLTLGLFGEYLGQVLEETKQRPLYIVGETSLLTVGAARADVLASDAEAPGSELRHTGTRP
jgi:glycosyltransferase involved in cell wall biosynthesis